MSRLPPETIANIEKRVADRCDGEHVYVHEETHGIALIMHGDGFVLRHEMSRADLASNQAAIIDATIDALCDGWDRDSPEREDQRRRAKWMERVEAEIEEKLRAEEADD